jgi:hypothetical protein
MSWKVLISFSAERHGAHPRGGVLWTIREVARRHLLMHQYELHEHDNPGSVLDQGLLGFALGVTSNFGLSNGIGGRNTAVAATKKVLEDPSPRPRSRRVGGTVRLTHFRRLG